MNDSESRHNSGAGHLEGLATGPRNKQDHLIHWREWDDETFAIAQREDKLILLDITAVWCHWCHVMDETTYSDPEVIQIINDHYIPVRVDADSRPDIQDRYISGGWPTTAFLAPTGEKIYGATYVPKEQMTRLLTQMNLHYQAHKAEILQQVEQLKQEVLGEDDGPDEGESVIPSSVFETIDRAIADQFDTQNGGFGTQPKFPAPDAITYCLMRFHRDAMEGLRQIAVKTLEGQLGIIDPVWGGMYRYSVNAEWTVPHFEKMLSTQAGALENYLDHYLFKRDPRARTAIQDIVRYVRRFLFDTATGAYYGSQDADVGSHEAAQPFITGEEYFEWDEKKRLAHGIPHVDKFTYTNWACQMAAAAIRAGIALEDDPLLKDGLSGLAYVQKEMTTSTGALAHSTRNKKAPMGLLTDHAAYLRALLAAYQATGETAYLKSAVDNATWIRTHLEDPQNGGFTYNPVDPNAKGFLKLRDKPYDDNMAAARGLVELAALTGDPLWEGVARSVLKYFGEQLRFRGFLGASYGVVYDLLRNHPTHIVIVGAIDSAAARTLHCAAYQRPEPYKIIQWLDPQKGPLKIGAVTYPAGKTDVAYVCVGTTCSSPLSTPAALESTIAALKNQRI